MEEQNCQYFSVRGYVAEMRVNNPDVCNPFEGRRNGGRIWERLRGPLDVPRSRWWRCENCVRRVVSSSTSAEERLNVEHSLQISIPVAGNNSSVEHRAARDDLNKTPIEVIILDDSDEEEVTKDKEKTLARSSVPTNTRQSEKRPCLDKGKSIIIEIEDDGEESDRQPPYGQAVLDDLNARIARTAKTPQNQQQQKRNTFSSSTLDLSLSLSAPGNQKRKGSFGAMDNGQSSLKSCKRMEMGNYLGKPFTSCEIIDLESASFNTDGTTKPVTTAYAKHANADPTKRNNAKATGESSGPGEGLVKKSGSGANPQVGNMSNMAVGDIGRPPSPNHRVCNLSRNPADFSSPDPGNIYMRFHL